MITDAVAWPFCAEFGSAAMGSIDAAILGHINFSVRVGFSPTELCLPTVASLQASCSLCRYNHNRSVHVAGLSGSPCQTSSPFGLWSETVRLHRSDSFRDGMLGASLRFVVAPRERRRT